MLYSTVINLEQCIENPRNAPWFTEMSWNIITLSKEDIFRVTGPLCGEFTGHRWISHTKASNAEFWCFLWSAPEQTFEQTIETPVIWDAIVTEMIRSLLPSLILRLWIGHVNPYFTVILLYTCTDRPTSSHGRRCHDQRRQVINSNHGHCPMATLQTGNL